MNGKCLGKLLYLVALAYLNDIIVPSKSVKNGTVKLRFVLQSLREAGVTIKLEKCRFFMEKLNA